MSDNELDELIAKLYGFCNAVEYEDYIVKGDGRFKVSRTQKRFMHKLRSRNFNYNNTRCQCNYCITSIDYKYNCKTPYLEKEDLRNCGLSEKNIKKLTKNQDSLGTWD